MPSYTISSGLPDLPVGLKDADAALVGPIYRAVNALAQQLSLLTGNIQFSAAEQAQIDQLSTLIDHREQRIYVKALELLPYGALVTISLDGGKLSASLADATNLNKPAHGICDTIGGIPTGEFGVIIFSQGRSAGVAGTILGTTYYLSTAGTMQAEIPTASGVIIQVVGTGLGSAGFYLNAEQYRSGVAVAISAVTADAPLVGSGTAASHLSIPAATGTVDGYLKSVDWVTFNSKQSVLPPTTQVADFAIVDTDRWVINNKTSACIVTLPDAASFPGRELTFHNYQAFPLNSASNNVVPQSGGVAGTVILLGVAGNWATLVSDGTNWVTMQAAANNVLLLE